VPAAADSGYGLVKPGFECPKFQCCRHVRLLSLCV
jgi:hypothetical protein